MSQRITLAEAIKRFCQGAGASLRSYESYRKDAFEHGYLHIGGKKVAAVKSGGRWTVDAEEFAAGVAAAVEEHRVEQLAIKQADEDYAARKLHPSGHARMSWGSYRVSGAFHFVSSDYERIRQRSNGSWHCSTCWQPASTENNKPECHTCSDWNGCGTDCTLSRVYCEACNTSLTL